MRLLLALIILFGLLILVNADRKRNMHNIYGTNLTLNEKVNYLQSMRLKNALLHLNGQQFQEYIANPPRNYSVIVMLTALAPLHECLICEYALDEFTVVANSYRYSAAYSNELFFVSFDYDDAANVFKIFRVNMVPMLIYIPITGKPKIPTYESMRHMGFEAADLARFVAQQTNIRIQIYRPFSYSYIVILLTTMTVSGGYLYARRDSLKIIYHWQTWSIPAVVFCILMSSGQMWNHIKSPPMFLRSPEGEFGYITTSRHSQTLMESYLVLFFNAMIIMGVIFLLESDTQTDETKKFEMVTTGLTLTAVCFAILNSIFSSKLPQYSN